MVNSMPNSVHYYKHRKGLLILLLLPQCGAIFLQAVNLPSFGWLLNTAFPLILIFWSLVHLTKITIPISNAYIDSAMMLAVSFVFLPPYNQPLYTHVSNTGFIWTLLTIFSIISCSWDKAWPILFPLGEAHWSCFPVCHPDKDLKLEYPLTQHFQYLWAGLKALVYHSHSLQTHLRPLALPFQLTPL